METPKINYADYQSVRFVKTDPISKTREEKNEKTGAVEKNTYFEIPMMYEYDYIDKDGKPVMGKDGKTIKILADLRVEGPEMYTSSGISVKIQKDKETASLFSTFDLTKPEIRAFVNSKSNSPGDPESWGFWEKIYQDGVKHVFDAKGALNLGRLEEESMVRGMFSEPIFWARDKATGTLIKGKNPVKYFNLINYGKRGSFGRKETVFTLPIKNADGKGYQRVEWDILTSGVSFKFKPLIHFKKIYVGGGKASLQFDIESAVITDIQQSGAGSAQNDTLENAAKDEVLTSKLRDQIDSLTRAFRESKFGPQKGGDDVKVDDKPQTINTPSSTKSSPSTNSPGTGAVMGSSTVSDFRALLNNGPMIIPAPIQPLSMNTVSLS